MKKFEKISKRIYLTKKGFIMISVDKIRRALKNLYADSTQQELARRAGISQSYMGKLLNGKVPIEKMQVNILLRLFPDMILALPLNAESMQKIQDDESIIAWLDRPENRVDRLELLAKIEREKKNNPGNDNIRKIS